MSKLNYETEILTPFIGVPHDKALRLFRSLRGVDGRAMIPPPSLSHWNGRRRRRWLVVIEKPAKSPSRFGADGVARKGWTGRKVDQKRAYDNLEVCYSKASGWYVFDHETDLTVTDGIACFGLAMEIARKARNRRKTNWERGIR